MTVRLDGKVAIVTGAGRGIGRATARLLAERGARVVVNDLGVDSDGSGSDPSVAGRVVAEIEASGGEALANADSVADFAGAGRLVEAALEGFGGLHILVNNAGLSAPGPMPIWEAEPELFARIVASHVAGTYNCTRHAAGHLKAQGRGSIVNLVSRAGLVGMPGTCAYGTAKGGIFAFTNVVSRDLAPFGVRVNAVNPASTETRMVTRAIEGLRAQGAAGSAAADNLAAQLQPPENVAALIAALCCDPVGDVTGQVFFLRQDEIGIYQPPALGELRRQEGGWSLDALVEAIPGLDLCPLDRPY
jgi:NAD(P)-dependent dehydrogenase (short-subunit alcohol dehydrogenase family)